MSGNCDTKVKQILDAIEYGKLLPADTEKRLLDMIEHEINKEDTAADMGLISIAQDLLFELHSLSCERTEENERRLDQLRKRISGTVAKREAYGNAMRRVIKIGAAVAVFVLLVVGVGYPLQLTWFESWSTPDEQQRVVQLLLLLTWFHRRLLTMGHLKYILLVQRMKLVNTWDLIWGFTSDWGINGNSKKDIYSIVLIQLKL